MTIAASGVYAFVGLGGPYWANDQDTHPGALASGSGSAVGIALQNVSLALAFFQVDRVATILAASNAFGAGFDSTNAADWSSVGFGPSELGALGSSFFAMSATATSASLVGLGSLLTVSLRSTR